jgi:hypothetical protein
MISAITKDLRRPRATAVSFNFGVLATLALLLASSQSISVQDDMYHACLGFCSNNLTQSDARGWCAYACTLPATFECPSTCRQETSNETHSQACEIGCDFLFNCNYCIYSMHVTDFSLCVVAGVQCVPSSSVISSTSSSSSSSSGEF